MTKPLGVHFLETQFGFEFGSARVERLCSDRAKGWVVINVKTPKSGIQIYVTKTGKIRVYNNTKDAVQELK